MITKPLLAVSLLTAAASAQCATLTITGTGLPGTTLQVTHDGTAANTLALLAVSETQGTNVVDLGPLGSLTLGVQFPLIPFPLGLTDANGDVSRSFDVPSAATLGFDVFGQGVTLDFSFSIPAGGGMPTFSLSSCASNVVAFHVGV